MDSHSLQMKPKRICEGYIKKDFQIIPSIRLELTQIVFLLEVKMKKFQKVMDLKIKRLFLSWFNIKEKRFRRTDRIC